MIMAGALDPQALLAKGGAWAVLAVTFAETGLPVLGVFLPGDTLLLPAGLACSLGVLGAARLPLPLVLVCAGVGSLVGAQTGFWIGSRGRRTVRLRGTGSRRQVHMARAEALFLRYGPRRALILGRFIPVVRTLVHPAAGLLGMPTATFTLWQAVAGLAWSQSLVLAGYALGESGRRGSSFLAPVVAAVVAASVLPAALQWLRGRRAGRRPAGEEPTAPAAAVPPRSRPESGRTRCW
jgi:membrane-associated protein